MRKKPTIEEIRAKVVGRQFAHTVPLERAAGEIADRTLPIAITSDLPIRHWFGELILNHAPECIRMERLNAGAPLLLEHTRGQKIGGLLNARTDGHVLRADAKFSRRPEADAELRDIEDGIGRGISGGFAVHHIILVEEKDDFDVYRCDDWTPLEASFVSIPADISVGVGRELDAPEPAEPQPEPVTERARPTADETVPSAPLTITEVRNPIMDKDQELIAIGERFGEIELARDFALADKTVAELKTAILEKRQKTQVLAPAPPVDLNAREIQQYSIARAILADAQLKDGQRASCFELEISQEIEKKLDASIKRHGGIFVPTLHRREELQRAGLDTATSTKGQTAVFTEYGGFIDLLRNKMMTAMLGITVLPGLQGNVGITRQTGAGTFTWVAQNPGSDVADSDLTLDLVTLTPKTGQSTTSYSRQLLAQSAVNVDSLVQNDLALINALGIDRAVIHGSGSSNQPTGIYAQSGINTKAFGGVISLANVVDMETEIALDNADISTMAYLTTPGARGVAKKTQEFASTNGMALWRDGEMNGYRAEASNQVSNTMLTLAATGGSQHGIIFGAWNQGLLGEWGAMELITDPYRLKKQGMIEVTSFVLVDFQLRYPTAFCVGTGQTLS